MGKIKLVGLDTMLFIYQFQQHPDYFNKTKKIFSKIEKGVWQGFYSTISYLELCSFPQLEGNEILLQRYKLVFLDFPHLNTQEPSFAICEKAAYLRRNYGLKTPDSILVATAWENEADMFITNDEQLQRVEEVEVVLMSDLL